MLGRFEVRVDGCTAIDRRWPRAKAKQILKLLALQVGRSMHRDQVAEAIWPGIDPEAAANNLHKNIHYLRNAVARYGYEGEFISLHDGTLELSSDVWIDAHEFVDECLRGRDAQDVDRLQRALARYRGELLPDDLYEPWTERHRDNLRALFVSGSLRLSSLLLKQGAFRQAGEHASAALQVEPTMEDAHWMLMRIHDQAGNRAFALRQYERCKDVLQQELGIEPGERIRALRRTILMNAGALAAPGRSATCAPPLEHAYTTDGARIAYWRLGDGPAEPLIEMPSLPHSDVQREWEIDEWRAFHERRSRSRTLVRYDVRGTGASRPAEPDFSIDASLADLEAVADGAELQRFALWASFHSGPAAITYAVRHPERVSRLVLWCSYARGSDLRQRDELTSLRRLVSADWHVYSESAAQFFFAWDHQQLARQYAALIRDSGDPETARAFIRAAADYDVSCLLEQVQTPTLVLYRAGMPWLDPAYSRELARRMPHAQARMIAGTASVPYVEGGEAIARIVERFIDAGCACEQATTEGRSAD
jgi:DNA-binding SARP family transcriptional activator/pimeloyl-ACP methyl ester carboxylesterase